MPQSVQQRTTYGTHPEDFSYLLLVIQCVKLKCMGKVSHRGSTAIWSFLWRFALDASVLSNRFLCTFCTGSVFHFKGDDVQVGEKCIILSLPHFRIRSTEDG